ncbi:DUF4386 family protein [Methanococcoides sp. SA1]|nr:DUF4386 family protein [Methanococcoides sp. SA1]
MTEEKGFNIDPSWKGAIKWGGLSLFAAGAVPVIFILSVFISQQTVPVPAGEILEDPVGPTALFLFAALGELLLLPGGLALYLTLKDVNKSAMLIATGLWSLCVSMFLVSRGLILSLYQVSGSYTATTSETMKAAYLASAEIAIETQSIYAYMGLILLSVASIIMGMVMLKGAFDKRIGYLVMFAGIWTFFTPFGVIVQLPFIIPFMGVILGAAWQIIVGVKLYKLG